MAVQLDFGAVLERWPMLLDGAELTMELALAATVLGFCLGTVCAVGRRQPDGWVSRVCGFCVELIRNPPFLVQICLIYFGLSSLGLSLSAFVVALLALSVNVGATRRRSCPPATKRSTRRSKPRNSPQHAARSRLHSTQTASSRPGDMGCSGRKQAIAPEISTCL